MPYRLTFSLREKGLPRFGLWRASYSSCLQAAASGGGLPFSLREKVDVPKARPDEGPADAFLSPPQHLLQLGEEVPPTHLGALIELLLIGPEA